MSKRVLWIVVGAIVAVVVLAVGGTYVYFNFIKEDAPPPLSVSDPDPGGGSGTEADPGSADPVSGAIAGPWKTGPGSQAGYRVQEILFGQSAEAVGRTDAVSGTMTIDATTVTAVDVTVDMASVTSDAERRDNQFRGRIMQTSAYPTSTFVLTSPILLPAVPADSAPIQVQATGDLTLHGVTKSVQADLTARRNGTQIEVSGSIPITFSEYSIPDPSFGPAKVGDNGELELLLVFTPG